MRNNTETYAMSDEQLSLLSISSAVATLASATQQPENMKGSTTSTAASGESIPESSENFTRQPSWSRTSRRLLLQGWTELSVTSKGTVTASLVASSKPPTSEPPTSESGSSSSASWPTPVARDANGQAPGKNIQGTPSLGHAVKHWPTATATDARSSARHGYMIEGHQGTTLLDAVRQEWPTPTVAAAEGSQKTRGGDRANEPLLGGMAGPGKLNPDWVETLMGLPIGWTDGPVDPETLLLFGNPPER
jgi:hypothetical protein